MVWGAPAWLPGSAALVFDGTIDALADHGLFRFTRDGQEAGPLVAPGQAPDVSRRGDIAYVNGGLRVLAPGATVPRRVTRRGAEPSWSPNARWLAFQRPTGPEHTDVYVVRSNGRGLRRLTRRGGEAPTWSPDGRSIAFVRPDGDVFVVKAAGGRSRRLLNLPGFDVEGFGEGVGAEAPAWQALPRR
jgi:dipeptidyl aminopeptidase/acylaminoacyl peptidase